MSLLLFLLLNVSSGHCGLQEWSLQVVETKLDSDDEQLGAYDMCEQQGLKHPDKDVRDACAVIIHGSDECW